MAKKQPTFEEALKQLETIADQIERGEIGLEESISKYEQGMKLVAQCRSILNRAEQRVQQLQTAAGDQPQADTDTRTRKPGQ
jgi:exodeoxyribonuclease VII small subunit